MEKGVRIVLLLLLLLLIIGLIYGVNAIPTREVTLRGFTDAVYRNPWKAAEEFLTAHDITVKTHRGLQKLYNLPEGNNSLLISSSRKMLTQERLDALMNWVEQGGHLITTAQGLFDKEREKSSDVLLDQLNVRKFHHDKNPHTSKNTSVEQFESIEIVDPENIEGVENIEGLGEFVIAKEGDEISFTDDETEENNLSNDARADNTGENLSEKKDFDDEAHVQESRKLSKGFDPLNVCKQYHSEHIASFYMPDDDSEYKAYFHLHNYLQDESEKAVVSIASKVGPQFLQFEQGKGLVTIITSMRLWNNFNIGCLDHAYLLYKLVEHSGRINILYTDDVPGLLALLWLKAKEVIIATGVFLLLLWWHRSLNLGPVLSVPSLHRRQLLEHIQAAGLYLWKYKSHGILLKDLRQDIVNKMQLRQRNFKEQDLPVQYEMIAHVCGCPVAKVKRLMTEVATGNYQTFTGIVKELQIIRKQL